MSEQQQQSDSSRFMLKVPMPIAVLAATGCVLLGLIYLFFETYKMVPSILPGYPGDAFFPRMVLIFCIFWAVFILARGLFLSKKLSTGDEEPYLSLNWVEFLGVSVLILLFSQLLQPVGFEIVAVVFMMVLLVPRLSETAPLKRAVWQSLALSVVMMLCLYLVFGPFLKIALPLAFLPIYF